MATPDSGVTDFVMHFYIQTQKDWGNIQTMRDLKHLQYFEDLLQVANNPLIKQAKEEGKVCIA